MSTTPAQQDTRTAQQDTGPIQHKGGDVEPQAVPLAGLVVVDLSTTAPGAIATQFLTEAGADVILVEPPGGSPLRADACWPALSGGKRSITLDVHSDADRDVLLGLLATADVLVTTMRPGTLARLGFGATELAELNPRLVNTAITGWGSSGPWANLKGYEGMVMAKAGLFRTKSRMITRPGPAFVSVPYATWGAAHTALQGILSALLERETSGLGQHVEADLLRGLLMIDIWTWFDTLIGIRWPGAYESVDAYTPTGEPRSALTYPLLIAPTSDGHWLQFAQVEPHLFLAMMQELGLAPLLGDPKWKGLPQLPTQELRTELWELMLARVGERTLEQWQHVFETNPNLSAEVFKSGPDVLNHPQLRHDGRVTVVDDPERGPVRRPSALVHAGGRPLSPPRPAPRLDEHGDDLRKRADRHNRAGRRNRAEEAPGQAAAPTAGPPTAASESAPSGLPLAGVTVLEFGLMFAGPFASTMLTDLGARVVKVETLAGDTIRRVLPFPEAGGARVMQGKESIAVDLGTDEGKAVVDELVRRSDVVLQAFRAGVAARAGVDEKSLLELNPKLVYVNAPGYGTDGPFGGRPAYAPSIGATAGLALTDVPDAAGATDSLDAIKKAAVRLNSATAVPTVQADGLSALGLASSMLLGLLARARQRPLDPITVTMLGTCSHALLDRVVDYAGRPASPNVDLGGYGYHALYRMYPTALGWAFLAAPAAAEWATFTAALASDPGLTGDVAVAGVAALGTDERFATVEARRENDAALAKILAEVFARRTAAEWERRLTEAGVGCVKVSETIPEKLIQTTPELADEYATTAQSPVFDEHIRVGPPVRFSRSVTQAGGGCLTGEHTDSILHELGYDDRKIEDLRAREIVG